ncbi:YopX family protein [Streptococcus sp. sy004]|uniref:YopX family protein n=1 Tax=Streptococcus sp. sy004 TaxID=2600149 RepID=UPI0011B6FD7A|nr:YopX family protein [Streptococcus sp. sy004]TWT12060.1 hypothetical protein FRX54_00580 [Streptococcus sp. sy004]
MLPKFRAWLKDKQRMVGVNFSAREEEMSVMQSTDMQDKNGQEIFEGDIVTIPYGLDNRLVKYLVKSSDSGEWRLTSLEPETTAYFSLFDKLEGLTIVGNRHENPELLEEVGFD